MPDPMAHSDGEVAPEHAEARRSRGLVWKQVGGVVLLLVLVGAAGWLVWSNWEVVPEVAGSSRADGEAMLVREGLRLGSVVTTYTGDEGQFATGTVMAVFPRAGTRVAPGRRIVLTVVGGPEWTTMAGMSGLTLAQAAERLRGKDVTISVVDPVHHAVPLVDYTFGLDLRVTTTSPRAGGRLERGGAVMLSVDRSVEATERLFVFAHPQEIYAKGIEGCYTGCHKELECSGCHLDVLGGRLPPEGVTVEEVLRDSALAAAGPETDEGALRLVRVSRARGDALTVVLNADAPEKGSERRYRMLKATSDLFKSVLGHSGIKDVTVIWVKKGTESQEMRARMTADTMWREKWTGLPPERLPELADSFSE